MTVDIDPDAHVLSTRLPEWRTTTVNEISFSIPDVAWTPCCAAGNGCAPDGRCRLHANVCINGARFYCEAVQVTEDEDGTQRGVCPDGESRMEGIAGEFDSSGFQTIDIGGREYAVFIVPGDA